MAKKHVDEYFNTISNQYKMMLDEIHDFEIECSKGLVDQERIDLVKKSVEPLMNNYMRWSYMMYLLNLPNSDKKRKSQEKRSKKIIKDTKTFVENNSVINKLKSQNNELRNLNCD